MRECVPSRRLELCALDAGDLDAWIRGDAAELDSRLGTRFPLPPEAPPLFAEDLPAIRELLVGSASTQWLWLMVHRSTREPVGVAGFSGRPDQPGRLVTGYSVYPRFERQGFTTEAMTVLLDRLRELAWVERVEATIPPWNTASVRVAEKLGMRPVGRSTDPEVGEVVVYELELRPRNGP